MEKYLYEKMFPIKILKDEHTVILEFLNRMDGIVREILSQSDFEEIKSLIPRLKHITSHFTDFEKHYSKEENVIFPHLEKSNIIQPVRELWNEHTQIRKLSKKVNELIDNFATIEINQFKHELEKYSLELPDIIMSHFEKENEVLFTAMEKNINEKNLKIITDDFQRIGYCCLPLYAEEIKSQFNINEYISLKNSGLDLDTINEVLKILPLDITILDKDDRIVYFNKTKDQLFLRTASIIGRDVILCHPPKAEKTVKKVMELLKKGKKEKICMWSNDKTKHIQYIAIRNINGEYLGCIETSQDITEYK